ncbi:MAG: hypothetical protein Q9210_007567, partial [Variospora velana]
PTTTSLSFFLPRRFRTLSLLLAILLIYLYLTNRSSSSPSTLLLLPHNNNNNHHRPSLLHKNIPWKRYAYIQHATSTAQLCNSVMVFEALSRLGSKAERVLVYPAAWDTQIASLTDRDSQLLVKAREWYGVRLVPVEDMGITYSDTGNMQEEGEERKRENATVTKFMAWKQTRYERVLYLDADVTVLKHLDELFLLPPSAHVAMMRAHWRLPEKRTLASNLILLQPSEEEYERLMTASRAEDSTKARDTDVEILNRFYGDSAMVLPHQSYGLLAREFRTEDHSQYFGNPLRPWDPERAFQDASLVHFLDEPFPKPWVMWPHALYGEMHPRCKGEDCRDKDIWVGLYDDFRKRRKGFWLIDAGYLRTVVGAGA